MEAAAPRYRIGRRLGRGGMAEVFEATALGAQGFERRVAIKRMNADVADDASFRQQFLDEARIASQLHHANIVAVLDFGLLDGAPFQVLELVDGADAAALLERGGVLPAAVALYVCAEVAHALEYAHRACDAQGRSLGIVHRDVSPQNVLIAWDGDVKLTDFGIAFAHDRGEKTLANVVKGKARYMAPEQWLGRGLDARVDVFALGCVLHALVTGESPLAAPGAVPAAIAGAQLALSDALPDDVRAIAARALDVRPDARFATAGAMGAALDAAVARRAPEGARTAARAWLAGLRPAPGTEPASSRARGLDVLLGLAPDGAPDVGAHTFVTRPALEPPATTEHTTTARSPAPRFGRTPRALALVALAGVVAVGVVSIRARVAPQRVAVVAVRRAPPPAQFVPPPVPLAARPPAPPPVPPPPHEHPRALAVQHPRVVPTEPVAPAREPGTGWLVVVGPGAVRGLLVIDGARHAEAQQLIALPLGHHHLELRPAGGGAARSRDVELVRTDTRASPQRWLIE